MRPTSMGMKGKAMKAKKFGAKALLVTCALLFPSCFTTNGAKWVFDAPSVYTKPDQDMENAGVRAIVGLPLLVTSLALDLVTWPFQLAFGVAPMWGESSTMAKPPNSN